MAESLIHLRLVKSIVRYVEYTYRPSYELAIFHDLPGPIGAEKPPRIGGYVPDVYAGSVLGTAWDRIYVTREVWRTHGLAHGASHPCQRCRPKLAQTKQVTRSTVL